MSYFRKQVLRDCSIVFSGIVPVDVDIQKTEAYRLCVQFGAVVTDNVNNSTTHVIAARWGTTLVQSLVQFDFRLSCFFFLKEQYNNFDQISFQIVN